MNKRVSRFSNILKPIVGGSYIGAMIADSGTVFEKTDLTAEDIGKADDARMMSITRRPAVAKVVVGSGVGKNIPVNLKVKTGDVIRGVVSVQSRDYAKLNINRPARPVFDFIEVANKRRSGKGSIFKIAQFSRKKFVSEK